MIFEVDSIGSSDTRTVWNLEEGLGKIGGFMGLISSFLLIILHPFIKNNLVFKLALMQEKGAQLGIDSFTFYWKYLVYDNMPCLRPKLVQNIVFKNQ